MIAPKKLLILDLDETLIHATKEKFGSPEDFRFDEYYIYKRPYLDEFLNGIKEHFLVGVWSSADDAYVTEIVKRIKPQDMELVIEWGRSKCSYKRNLDWDSYFYEKRLKKLKKFEFRLEEILIVDDTAEKSRTNYGNAIHIAPFTGDDADRELLLLLQYLLSLKDVEDFRALEKRGWRNAIVS